MLNMDFSKRVSVETNAETWLASPAKGVWRKPLAREDAERGHATSIVKYEPGAKFSLHGHPKGEEIFVLDGVFSDESGDYPAGTYFRNPEGYSHAPYSKEGCVLFVKLHQFQKDDNRKVCIDTNTAIWQQGIGGLEVMPLHEHKGESVALVKWPAGEKFQPHTHFGGEEILVLSGEFIDEHGRYPAGSWIQSWAFVKDSR
jgi:anti-sigma factor ChrR (cupin superfamily)